MHMVCMYIVCTFYGQLCIQCRVDELPGIFALLSPHAVYIIMYLQYQFAIGAVHWLSPPLVTLLALWMDTCAYVCMCMSKRNIKTEVHRYRYMYIGTCICPSKLLIRIHVQCTCTCIAYKQ